MAALTQDRNTPRKYVERYLAEDAKIAATTTVYNGALTAANANGELCPAADVASITVLGVSQQKMVNSTGAAANVTPKAKVAAGCFKFKTTGGNAITAADVGKNCYVLDDQTVVRIGGTTNAIVAGVVDSMDPDGDVWVKVNS